MDGLTKVDDGYWYKRGKEIKLPYLSYLWNTKRSGADMFTAYNNGTMSGIVIVVEGKTLEDSIIKV